MISTKTFFAKLIWFSGYRALLALRAAGVPPLALLTIANLVLPKKISARLLAISWNHKGDGGGSQILAVYSTLICAWELGLRYLHQPIRKVEHRTNSREEWEIRWEDYFGLSREFGQIDEKLVLNFDSRRASILESIRRRPRTVLSSGDFRNLVQYNPDLWLLHKGTLQKLLLQPNSVAGEFSAASGTCTISVHVRRGDVSLSQNSTRFTPTDDVQKFVNLVRGRVNPGLQIRICYFSNHLDGGLTSLAAPDVEIVGDPDPFRVFASLVKADHLITAKSAFSFLAGVLTNGQVYFEPYLNSAPSTWIRLT